MEAVLTPLNDMHACSLRRRRLAQAAASGQASVKAAGDLPVSALYPPTCLGATSEAFADAVDAYMAADPEKLFPNLDSTDTPIKPGKVGFLCSSACWHLLNWNGAAWAGSEVLEF